MIGGCIYDKLNSDIEIRLQNNMNQNFNKIIAWDNG